jgi:DNA-binding LacI/PurR family transcriptional regulator
MKAKRPTVRDVAREAGVSYQTVSRVINNNVHVSVATRERVQKVIDLLGFRPNRAAQIMQTKTSQTIEVVMPYYGFTRVLYDMARVTNQLGYHFVIAAIDPENFAETLESGASRFIDGFVLVPYPPIDEYDAIMELTNGIPFVQFGARLGANIPSVSYDQGRGSRLATQHLIDLGHKRIAEISGPLHNYDGRDRHLSWLATLKENGLTPAGMVEGDFNLESGYQAMLRLLDSRASFTGVVIGNDTMSFGAVSALRERGIRVPEDVSVVGFDDIPESAHFFGGLTTIHQDFALMARYVIEYVVSLIDNPDTPVYQQLLIPKLVVRETTRPPR